MKYAEARKRFDNSIREALGYIELAKDQTNDVLQKVMIENGLKALQDVSNNDDVIDALYDYDMKESQDA